MNQMLFLLRRDYELKVPYRAQSGRLLVRDARNPGQVKGVRQVLVGSRGELG